MPNGFPADVLAKRVRTARNRRPQPARRRLGVRSHLASDNGACERRVSGPLRRGIGVLWACTFLLPLALAHGASGPAVSNEVEIVAPFIQDLANLDPAVASNGTNWLVAWNKSVRGAGGLGFALINLNGDIVQRFDLSTTLMGNGSPALASDGCDFMVFWPDGRPTCLPSSESSTARDLYAVRIGGDGTVLTPGGFPIHSAVGGHYHARVAWNGTNYLVVWEDGRESLTNLNIGATLVSRAGLVANLTNTIPVSTFGSCQIRPVVASAGAGFLVIWEDDRNLALSDTDIYGARVDGTGNVIDSEGVPICAHAEFQQFPAVSSNARDYLVVWQDRRNVSGGLSGWSVYGCPVDAHGAVGPAFAIDDRAYDQDYPSVAGCADEYLVAWRDWSRQRPPDSSLRAARVRNGAVVDFDGFVVNDSPDNQDFPAVGFGADRRFLVVNHAWLGDTNRIAGNIVSVPEWVPRVLNIVRQGAEVTLEWRAEDSRSYRVQYRTNLASGTWQDLAGEVRATTNVASKVDGPLDESPQRFYRVVLLP